MVVRRQESTTTSSPSRALGSKWTQSCTLHKTWMQTLMQADAHTRTSLAGRERNPWPGEGGSATPKENGFWRMLPRFSRDCVPIAQVSAASHACSVPRWVSLQESPWRTGGREFAYFALKGNKCEKSNPVPDCWDTLTARGCNTVATSFEQSG